MDQAAKTAEELEHFVLTLAQAGSDERARLLSEWTAKREQEPEKPPRKRRKKDNTEPRAGPSNGHASRPRAHMTPNVLQDFVPAARAEDVAATAQEDEFRAGVNGWAQSPAFVATEATLFQEEASQLLDAFFCWQNPRYSFIDGKDAFLKDDSKCSTFLLWTIYAYASRFVPQFEPRCDEFAAIAHAYLAIELTKPSHITTAQGLLLLAAHHAARGRHSQAWQQKGFASCMIDDLEIVAEQGGDAIELKRLRRLYWSLHCWDTIHSLSVNRRPMIRADIDRDPIKDLADDLADDGREIWIPCISPSDTAIMPSEPQKSYDRRIFALSAQLYIIIDDVLERLYAGARDVESGSTQSFVFATKDKLLKWRKQVDAEIYLDIQHLPSNPPSPHRLQFNLLIRLVWILLYRNFCDASTSGVVIEGASYACETSAHEIYALFATYEHAYPLTRLTYLAIFAAFCSAVVSAQQLKCKTSDVPAILTRLDMFLRVLETGRSNVPGMVKAIAILHSQIAEAANRNQYSPSSTEDATPPPRTSPAHREPGLMPAKPAHELPHWSDFLSGQTDIAALCPGLSLAGPVIHRPAMDAPRWTPMIDEAVDNSQDWFARLAAGTW